MVGRGIRSQTVKVQTSHEEMHKEELCANFSTKCTQSEVSSLYRSLRLTKDYTGVRSGCTSNNWLLKIYSFPFCYSVWFVFPENPLTLRTGQFLVATCHCGRKNREEQKQNKKKTHTHLSVLVRSTTSSENPTTSVMAASGTTRPQEGVGHHSRSPSQIRCHHKQVPELMSLPSTNTKVTKTKFCTKYMYFSRD